LLLYVYDIYTFVSLNSNPNPSRVLMLLTMAHYLMATDGQEYTVTKANWHYVVTKQGRS